MARYVTLCGQSMELSGSTARYAPGVTLLPARYGAREEQPASDHFAARQRRGVADRGDVGLVGLQRAALEDRGARYKRIRAGGGQLSGDIRGHAAIDLDVDRTARRHRSDVADLAERRLD